jgi:hypothetical protein
MTWSNSGGARKKSTKKRSVRRAVGKATNDVGRVLRRTASRSVGVVGDVVGAAGQVVKGAMGVGRGVVRTGVDLLGPLMPSVQGKKILVNSRGGRRTRKKSKKNKSKKRAKAGMMSDLDELTATLGQFTMAPVDLAQGAAAAAHGATTAAVGAVPAAFAFPGGPGPLIVMGSKSKKRGPRGASSRKKGMGALGDMSGLFAALDDSTQRRSARPNIGILKKDHVAAATAGKKRTKPSAASIAKGKRTRARTKAKGYNTVGAMRSASAKKGRDTAKTNKELNALFGNLGF